MGETKPKRSRRRRGETKTVDAPASDVKSKVLNAKDLDFTTQFIKAFVYSQSGGGTTFGALQLALVDELKDKPLIIINTDFPLNLEDNLKIIPEEFRKNIWVPRNEDGTIMVVDSSAKWLSVKAKLEEMFGDFSDCAGIVLDYHDILYDAYIEEADPETPFAYRKPRNKFMKEVWDFVLNAKTNTVINSKAKPVYVDVGQGDQYKQHNGDYTDVLPTAEKWKTPFNYIIYRQKIFVGDYEKETYRSIFKKHKLGLKPLILAGDNSNLFTEVIRFIKEKQTELRDTS